jgi:hypothetical protein
MANDTFLLGAFIHRAKKNWTHPTLSLGIHPFVDRSIRLQKIEKAEQINPRTTLPVWYRFQPNWQGGRSQASRRRGTSCGVLPIRRHASRPTRCSWRSSRIEQPAQINGPIAVT